MKKNVFGVVSWSVLLTIPGLGLATESIALAQVSEAKPVATSSEPAAGTESAAPEASAVGEGESGEVPASTVPSGSAVPPESSASSDSAAAPNSAAPNSAAPSETDASGSQETASQGTASPGTESNASQAAPIEVTEDSDVSPSELPFTYHQKHIDIVAGLSLIGANNSGLDPYRDNSLLAEGFARVGATVMTQGPWAVALLGGIGGGSYSSNVRDQESHLSVLQFNVAAEGRYHFHHRFYGYGRLALGPELASTRIGSKDQDLRLTENNWAFRGELTAGLAMRVFGPSDGRERSARVWLLLEGGYRLSSSHPQQLSADEEDGPARPVDLELDSLSTSGGLGSMGLMLSF